MRIPALLAFLLMATASPLVAQPTNMEAFQALAVECMGFISDVEGDVVIDAPAKMPYVRSAITTSLNEEGRQVFLADSIYTDKPDNLATLSYTIDKAGVAYERQRKKKAKRTVSFTASTMLVSARGQVVADKVCEKEFSDVASIADLPSFESNAHPETKAPPLKAGLTKRIFQPVMLTAATALTVYLFFTLRSESSSNAN